MIWRIYDRLVSWIILSLIPYFFCSECARLRKLHNDKHLECDDCYSARQW